MSKYRAQKLILALFNWSGVSLRLTKSTILLSFNNVSQCLSLSKSQIMSSMATDSCRFTCNHIMEFSYRNRQLRIDNITILDEWKSHTHVIIRLVPNAINRTVIDIAHIEMGASRWFNEKRLNFVRLWRQLMLRVCTLLGRPRNIWQNHYPCMSAFTTQLIGG